MMGFRNFRHSFFKRLTETRTKTFMISKSKFNQRFSGSSKERLFSTFKKPSLNFLDSFLKNLKYPLYIYLIGANVIVFLIWKAPITSPYFMMKNFTFSNENLSKGRIHTIVTHAFSHFSLMHLGFNMLPLYFFGSFIEKSFGSKLLLQLYLAGAVLGALFSQTQNYQTHFPLHHLGASSAIASILTYFIMCFPQHTIFLFIIPLPAWMVGLFLFSQSLLFFNSQGGVSFSGHLGGIVAGATVFVLKRRMF